MNAPLSLLLAMLLAAPAKPAKTPASSLPAAPPTAASVLAKVRRAYTASPATIVTFVQRYVPAGFTETGGAETGKLTVQPPNLLRFDYDGPEGKVYTFDGTTARQYVAEDRQLIVKALTPEERSRLPLLFLEDPASLLSRYDAALKPAEGGAPGVVDLTLTPKREGETKEVLVTAGPDGDVKKLVVLDTAGNRTTFTFTTKSASKRRPASDFKLVPPKGTKTITG